MEKIWLREDNSIKGTLDKGNFHFSINHNLKNLVYLVLYTFLRNMFLGNYDS